MPTSTSKAIAMTLLLLLLSTYLLPGTLNVLDGSELQDNRIIEDDPEFQFDDCTQDSPSSASRTRAAKENNAIGGSWVDDFEDDSEIDSLTNLKNEDDNYRLTNDNISTFFDRFEGSDGTNLDTYDPDYTVYSTASSNYDAEIDTAQKREGSSSAKLYLNDWAENVEVNRTVNYDSPILECTYYTRMYTVGGANANVGCSLAFVIYSGATRLSTIVAYGRYFYYNNGSLGCG
jgi:hypothetical protein